MFHDAIPDFFAVCLIFFGAGAVKGILGMGLPTLAMGLLGLVMPVAGAASLLTVPSLVTNLWQAAGRGLLCVVRRLWLMQAGIVAGVLLAPVLFPGRQEALGRPLLGGCLLAYGALGLAGWRIASPPQRWEQPAGLLAGVASGIVTGLTGVFVLPAVPYLQSLALGKDALSQALGLCFTTSTLALAVLLAAQGHLDRGSSLASAVVVVPAVLGMVLGQAVRKQMSEALFRRCFFGGLLLLGAWLLMRSH
ncbi:MAG: sulfite exporter TauE/SafE family protein [Pseudomonadota bacterium]